MKLKINPLSKSFKPIKVYAEDLTRIYEVLKEKANDFKIITDKYEFNEWNEFINDSKPTKTLEISAKNSQIGFNIELKIYEYSTYLYGGWGEKDENAYTFLVLSDVIKELEILRPIFFAKPLIFFYNFIFLFWLLFGYRVTGGLVYYTIYLILFILTYISIDFFYLKSKISLKGEGDTKSFLIRNRDSIIVGCIFFILSTIISLIITHYSSPAK